MPCTGEAAGYDRSVLSLTGACGARVPSVHRASPLLVHVSGGTIEGDGSLRVQ